MKILVTGFEPFGGEEVNAAWEAVRQLRAPAGAELMILQLPTVFGWSGDLLCRALAVSRPDLVLCVGQAAGRGAVTPERIAVNLMDASLPDNADYQPADQPVVPGGPGGYLARLPVKELARALSAAGVPAQVSSSAGFFVCNSLFYRLMHEMEARYPAMCGGFVHIPCLPEQAAARPEKELPSLPLEQSVLALQTILDYMTGVLDQLERAVRKP